MCRQRTDRQAYTIDPCLMIVWREKNVMPTQPIASRPLFDHHEAAESGSPNAPTYVIVRRDDLRHFSSVSHYIIL
ncbi:hypothetical protein KIN20_001693 [Parelaphostrongylus tenuis]|uniref:Uncharacterized protein n=1 Tax=Parelaphostrongylus tenuis TaxID=148309 RepID=A0AAD5MCY8_PARTN|nr:hypothetical protein KIN20_001693 [Parelaphostrongylus tenuis]